MNPKLLNFISSSVLEPPTQTYHLTSLADLELHNVHAELVTYRGRQAIRMIEVEDDLKTEGHSIAVLPNSDFKDGILETEVVGLPVAGTEAVARGFVGIAFRVQPSQFECFYLRPTNGRANDQLRRNHATQYISHPDYPWHRLREENPGVYESYTDLEVGVWTKIKLVVLGIQAQLYVNGAEQPCLIVNDLKLGETRGKLALWIGYGTEAYFSTNVIVR